MHSRIVQSEEDMEDGLLWWKLFTAKVCLASCRKSRRGGALSVCKDTVLWHADRL